MMPISLSGKAAEISKIISSYKYQDYSFFKSQLMTRFGDEHLKLVYKAETLNKYQKQGKTLEELEAAIGNLYIVSYPETSFVNVIADTAIKQAVLLSGKTSSEVVLEKAKEKIKPSEEKLEEIIIMKKNGNEFSFGWEDPWVAYYTYNLLDRRIKIFKCPIR